MRAKILSIIKDALSKAFGKYLVATNVVSSGLLMSIGDSVEQVFELKRNDHPKGAFDWNRVAQMTYVGFAVGGPQHFFYKFMDDKLPGTTKITVTKKILLDQLLASPCAIALFFYGLGILETGTLAAGHEELKSKFSTVYMFDWCFWPPTQFINFFYLSPKYRVMYVNAMTMIYDVFLSYMKFIHSPSNSSK